MGYCQGTNQIVAILLIFLTEEDVFWALAQLMTYGKHTMQVRGWMGRWSGLQLRTASLQGHSSHGAGGDPHLACLPTGMGTASPGGPWFPGATATCTTICRLVLHSRCSLSPDFGCLLAPRPPPQPTADQIQVQHLLLLGDPILIPKPQRWPCPPIGLPVAYTPGPLVLGTPGPSPR